MSKPISVKVKVSDEGIILGNCFISHEAILKARGPIVQKNYREWLSKALNPAKRKSNRKAVRRKVWAHLRKLGTLPRSEHTDNKFYWTLEKLKPYLRDAEVYEIQATYASNNPHRWEWVCNSIQIKLNLAGVI